jgi:hypothetical protein
MRTAGIVLFGLSATALVQPQTAPKPAVVEGKVVGPVTGEPLRKAGLTLTTLSDAAGKFRFEQVLPGAYFLSPSHAGYVNGRYAPEVKYAADGKLVLEAGDSVAGVLIRLVPLGLASGRWRPSPNGSTTGVNSVWAN